MADRPEHQTPSFLKFYSKVLYTAVTELFELRHKFDKAVLVLLSIVTYFSKEIADRLGTAWNGLSRWWAIAPVVAVLLYRLLRENYSRFLEQTERANQAALDVKKISAELERLKDDLR